jgi:hypothetical protein
MTVRWRPLVPVRISNLHGVSFGFGRALIDPGADDTIFPLDVAILLKIPLYPPTAHAMRWRGGLYALSFGDVELALMDDTGTALRWNATIGFTKAPIRYPLLGVAGCLQFFNANLLGEDRVVEIEPTPSCPLVSSGP